MIKAIIFDCFGVLIMPGRTLLYQAFPELAASISHLEKRSDAGEITHQEFIQAIAQLTGINENVINDKYYDVHGYHEAMIGWANELKRSGRYKIAMLSNIGHDWLNDFLASPEINGLFDEVVLSCEEGMLKPNPEIFRLIAKRLNLNPEDCLMIDDIPANIDGAESTGMKGVVFNSTIQTKRDVSSILEANNA